MVKRKSIQLIALGLALVPLAIGLNEKGILISLPLWFGITLWISTKHLPLNKQDLFYFIPLTLISVLAVASLISNSSTLNGFYLAYIIGGFLLFLAIRDLGSEVTRYIAPAAALVAISVIIDGIVTQNSSPRGITPNANLAAGYMFIGVFFCRGHWKWLIPIIAVGLLFTGYEAILIFAPILGIIALLQYRESIKIVLSAHRKLIYGTLGVLIIVVIIGAATGLTESVYATNMQGSLDGRLDQYRYAIDNMSILGQGYDPGPEGGMWIHNVPLLIAVEFGVLAALAWIFVMGYATIRGHYRYPILALGMLSMVGVCWKFCDLSPVFWALMGLSANAAVIKREESYVKETY